MTRGTLSQTPDLIKARLKDSLGAESLPILDKPINQTHHDDNHVGIGMEYEDCVC